MLTQIRKLIIDLSEIDGIENSLPSGNFIESNFISEKGVE